MQNIPWDVANNDYVDCLKKLLKKEDENQNQIKTIKVQAEVPLFATNIYRVTLKKSLENEN